MDVCPPFFSQPLQLPPSPNATGHNFPAPGLPLDIIFDKAMDQTVTPALTDSEVVIDGTPEFPTVLVWLDSTTLQVTFAGVPIVSGVWNLLNQTVNLRGLDGSVVKKPQSQAFFP